MNQFLLLVVFLFGFNSNAQQIEKFLPNPKYPELFKTIPLVESSDPDWVHLMYSENPNYYSIEKAYSRYFKTHLFKKTTHTQNFKHLSRILNVSEFVKEDGTIYLPTLQKKSTRIIDSKQNKYEPT